MKVFTLRRDSISDAIGLDISQVSLSVLVSSVTAKIKENVSFEFACVRCKQTLTQIIASTERGSSGPGVVVAVGEAQERSLETAMSHDVDTQNRGEDEDGDGTGDDD